jgi:hypothetical protein
MIAEVHNIKKQKALKFLVHNRIEKEKANILNQSIKSFNFWVFKTAKMKTFNEIESVKN